jgi:dipeptidyl-peptidase 4
MKVIVWLVLLLVLAPLVWAADAPPKKLTFEQAFLFQGEPLLEKLPPVIGWLDGQRYLEMSDNKVLAVTAASGKTATYFDPAVHPVLQQAGLNPQLADDRTSDWKNLLFHKGNELILYSLAGGKLTRWPLELPAEPQNPTLSPDGRSAAFTAAGDLYVTDLAAGKTTRVTRDGSEQILNGYASWVYYEEILGRRSRYRAFWWSPKGDRIAFLRFDQAAVPVFPLFQVTGDYGKLENQRYPKAGYANPVVRLGVWTRGQADVGWLDLATRDDDYLAFPAWTASGDAFYLQWMNHAQDTLRVYSCPAAGGKPSLVYQETQPSWVAFFDDGKFEPLRKGGFLAVTDKGGWSHLLRVDAAGRERFLTAGEWAVSGIAEVDETGGRVLFTARHDASTETGLFAVGLDGRGLKRLTPAGGSHYPLVAPGGTFIIDRWSAIDRPTRMDLLGGTGKPVRILGDSDGGKLKEYLLGREELFRIPTSDGWQLPARWCLPANLDKGKKYPLVFQVYGGPGAPVVSNSFSRGWASHYLAAEGVITIAVDHRGSGHFGKKGEALMHRRLGFWELNDLTEAVHWLVKTYPFVDPARIGITGGSYGGYVAALAVVKAGDVFPYGIADFGVMDWRLYDSVYTERFMDTPTENPEGYKDASVLTWVDRYKGGLRLAHGTMDDNVHMQNSLQLLDKILSTGKTVEFMLYPGERHGFRGPKTAEYNRSTLAFWLSRFFGRATAN